MTRRASEFARAGRWTKGAQLLRAGIAAGRMKPGAELRARFRLLRWELAAAEWDDVLRSVEGLYGRLARRNILAGPVAGWVLLARAVAQFHLGEGTKYRRSLARVLRAARRAGAASLCRAAVRVGAEVDALGQVPGERAGILLRLAVRREGGMPSPDGSPLAGRPASDGAESVAALAALLRGDPRTRPLRRPFRWTDLPLLVGGPRRFRPALAASRVGKDSCDRLEPPDGGPADPAGAGEDPGTTLIEAWIAGAQTRPRRRLPVWLVPALARLAEDRIPEAAGERRERIMEALGALAVRAREPWARAFALAAQAEGRLWRLDPGNGPGAPRRAALALIGARSDLALAAGLFRGVGWHRRADACERRWARLALPVLGPHVAEPSTAVRPRLDENEEPGSDFKPGHARRFPGGADADPGRVQRTLAEAGFLTGDPRTLRDLAPLLLLAATPLPVLILGESGTGKEVLARALHRWSRLRGDLVAIHCGAIPRDLLESELFGHSRGAFTGAAGDKPGLIEAADGGSLFLDEIGEMGVEAQMKMLRVLESGEVRRLGELRPRRTALRLVAATHRDLVAEVERGAFRLDLFHRIRGVVVRVRPLRERRGDIPLLAGRFLASAGEGGLRFSAEGLASLVAQPWRGNVRELKAGVLRAAHLARALGRTEITPGLLGIPAVPLDGPADPSALALASRTGSELSPAAASRPPGEGAIPDAVRQDGLDAYLDRIERDIIVRALSDRGWNRTHAARDLGGISRTTLIGKIRRLGIEEETAARRGEAVAEG